MKLKNNCSDYTCADCGRRFSEAADAINHECRAAEARKAAFDQFAFRMLLGIVVMILLLFGGVLLAVIRYLERHS